MPQAQMTQTPASIQHLNLPVTDLEKSLEFYINGLGFRYVQHLREGKVILDFAGFNFFLEVSDRNLSHDRFHFGIKTTTEGVYEWAGKIAEKGIPQVVGNQPTGRAEVYTTPDGVRTVFYMEDPDGHIIEVYSHIGVDTGFVRAGYGAAV
jgi:catechol 2,3-dioxygenase-like lactoylglutathione lyase family enzyme